MKKIFSLLLAAVLLCSTLVSCGGDPVETTAPVGDTVTTEPAADAPDLPDPATLDIDGEFRILVSGNSTRNDYHSEGDTGTAVQIAIYRRNELIKEKYGVEIIDEDITAFGSVTGSGKGFTTIYTEYMAGESTYDAAAIGTYDVATLAYSGYIHDLNDMPYIDLTKPYWDQKANEDLAINGRMYYTTGEIGVVDNYVTHAILFNKEMVEEYGLDNPYDLVRDDAWTLEAFARLGKSVGEDLNQDGMYDENDLYGVMTWKDPMNAILASAGERIATVNDEGLIELTFYNERVVNLYDQYLALTYDQAHVYNYQYDNATGKQSPTSTWDTNRDAIFNGSRAVFYMQTIGAVERHRDTEVDFGILPYPKMDENQQEYGHQVSNYHANFICVPELVKDYDRSSIILEELAYQGLRLLTPAFYDQTLVGRYIRDEESAEMLDIIFATHVYDIGACYKIGGYNEHLNSLCINRGSLASMYETYRSTAERMIQIINMSMQAIQ